ncbi:hypothetical protein XI03_25905 [Bradyrhizobium sp. CCBAU 65884]|uniref:hypothetical protein n=1 Tax=Bradyrhizobium sp. CCBAU 65884 TaxID=722477 RepID=UPI002306A1D2|nr:hypothetical protein [Bradyrhizobium sp. CCBAU 65884]MDA9477855.1 hypothetical protein [Bradyrhizobium sp. CCBAU 65884]
MTKAENRAAAKVWREYRRQQRRDAERAADVAADLAELDRLRRYLIFGRRAPGADAEKLCSAIDDYVEQLTGDRSALHARSSSIG